MTGKTLVFDTILPIIKHHISSNHKSVASENYFYNSAELNSALGIEHAFENYLAQFESIKTLFFTYLLTCINERKILTIEDKMLFLYEFLMGDL